MTQAAKAILFISVLVSFGCSTKDVEPRETGDSFYTEEAYVIGVDPCTASSPTGTPNRGYVLSLLHSNKTVVTYNLSPQFSKPVDDSVSNLKSGLIDGFLLPAEERSSHFIKISYRYAKEGEKVYPLCPAVYNTSGYAQHNEKQVIVEK